MIVVRSDTIGTVSMKLVCRPTNTCVGVENFSVLAKWPSDEFTAPLVRFLGTDEGFAHARYEAALEATLAIYEGVQ